MKSFKRWIPLFAVLAWLVIFAGACGNAEKSGYVLHTYQEYGVKWERYVPENELPAEQTIVKIPGGDFPDNPRWTTHNSGCKVFTLSETEPPLPVEELVSAVEGAQFPSNVSFAISCPAGARIFWDRNLPAVVPATPEATPNP